MNSERPNLFRECKKCIIATRTLESEAQSPVLPHIGNQFESTNVEIVCDVQPSGSKHIVYMTPWHVGNYSNGRQDMWRERITAKVPCPHFKSERA